MVLFDKKKWKCIARIIGQQRVGWYYYAAWHTYLHIHRHIKERVPIKHTMRSNRFPWTVKKTQRNFSAILVAACVRQPMIHQPVHASAVSNLKYIWEKFVPVFKKICFYSFQHAVKETMQHVLLGTSPHLHRCASDRYLIVLNAVYACYILLSKID